MPCSLAVMLARSDTPFEKWCISENRGSLLKLENQRSERGLPKPQTDRLTSHPKSEVLHMIDIPSWSFSICVDPRCPAQSDGEHLHRMYCKQQCSGWSGWGKYSGMKVRCQLLFHTYTYLNISDWLGQKGFVSFCSCAATICFFNEPQCPISCSQRINDIWEIPEGALGYKAWWAYTSRFGAQYWCSFCTDIVK